MHFGAGYYSGRGMFSGFLVFPIENATGELVAYGGISLEDGSYLYPKQFRPELELYNLTRVRGSQLDIVVHPHEAWHRFEDGQLGVVATMIPSLSKQQERLLAMRQDRF